MEIFSTIQPLEPGELDAGALLRRSRELDNSAALNRVLIGYSSIWPHNHATTPFMLAATQQLSLIIAHRPGVMDPTTAARFFATLDVLSGSRIALNIVVGGSDKDLAREGDYTPKVERYSRALEYVEVMKQTWAEAEPFDHDGTYYRADRVHPLIAPRNGHVPIFMGGESDEAVDFGARHADRYMLWGEPLAGTKERIERVQAVATQYGRNPQFSVSLRLFLGDTEDDAWAKARAAEAEILDAQGSFKFLRSSSTDTSVGRGRQLALTEQEVHDDCFWTGLTKLLGGFANSAALVGTTDQVMATLQRYKALGVDAFLFTTGAEASWDPSLEDFGQRVRKEL